MPPRPQRSRPRAKAAPPAARTPSVPRRDAPPSGRSGTLPALLALAAFALAACGGESPDAETRPLVVGYSADLQTLNPLVSTDQNANELIWFLTHTPLVTYDSAYEVRPWLAESWELADSSVVFELRDDVRWHDGEPVTAEDVKFTFDAAKDPAVPSLIAAAYLANVEDAEVLDTHRIRFTFTAPHSQPLEGFYWPPVPRHLLEDVPPEEIARHGYGRDPVGSGPYRLRSWDVGEGLVFDANDDFSPSLGGPPEIGTVFYRIVPEATTRLRQLLNGTLQVDGPLSPADAEEVRASEGARLETFLWRMFTYIGWNARDPRFEDPDVRRALTMAIDREALLEAALYDLGTIATGVVPPWHPYSPDLEPLPHDPDSAAALLESRGWRDVDGDGIRERDGEPFRFTLLAAQGNATYGDLAQMLQAQLRRVGIALEPRLLEWQTVLSRHRSRDFEAVLTNWVLDNFRVDPRPLFHSEQVDVEGSANRSSYANPVADSLMELGVRTTDPERAAEIWAALSRVIQRDQPFTFLFWNDELAGVSADLEGVRMDARGELVTLPRWRWSDADEERGGGEDGDDGGEDGDEQREEGSER